MSEATGYTKVPNALIDALLDPSKKRRCNGAELKVALLIARDTIGWRKPSARISVATFQKRLGLSRSTTLGALRGLRDKTIIEAEGKDGTVQSYSLTSPKNCTGSEVSTGTEICANPSEKLDPPVQKTGPAYKEERNSSQRNLSKKTSSSNQDPAVSVHALAPEVVAATDDEPVSMKPSAAEAEAEAWQEWTEETLAGFCDMLANHRGQPIDLEDARTWLRRGSLRDALRWWLKCGHKLKPNRPTGYGLYIADHGKWIAGNQPELSFFEQTALDEFRYKHGLVTAAEREAEAERQRQEAAEEARKHREAEEQRREREERRASYLTMSGGQIREEIERLSQQLGVIREYKEQQHIEYDLKTLKALPAYQEYLKTPAVRRPQIQQELELARQMLSFCADRPQSREQIEGRIEALEAMLADLDGGGIHAPAEQTTPTAPAATLRKHDHRKGELPTRSKLRDGCRTAARLDAVMGGCAA